MREPDFNHSPLSLVGSAMHWLLGPSVTTVTEGPAKSRCVSIPTDTTDPWPQATVSCVRVIYRTQYTRWWVPNVNRTLYTVSMDVPPALRVRYGDELFEPVTYPLLCNHLLQWTTYPHLTAILAYLDALLVKLERVSPHLSASAMRILL